MRIVKHILSITFAATTTGCAMGGLVSLSKPYIENPDVVWSSGILKLNDVEVSVKPQTYKVSFLTVGPLLPIIPIGAGNDFNRQHNLFTVVIQFESKIGDTTLIPSMVKLDMSDKQYLPVAYLGPLNEITDAREAAKAIPGHVWECNSHQANLLSDGINNKKVIHEKTCFIIQYPIVTPSVQQEFEINIDGLYRGDVKINVPIINFKSGYGYSFSILG